MKRAFGSWIVGMWAPGEGCTHQKEYFIFPKYLFENQEEFKWVENHPDCNKEYLGPACKECGKLLSYDEAE